VLAELCRRPSEVVAFDALLDACWPGETHGDNPVHKVVAVLRRALQDSATTPRYIETIRKQGYRLIAPIRVLSEQGPRSHEGGWRGQSPFRGLEPFGPEHASVFFGRDGAVAELHARLSAQWHRGHPLVVLLGPSGSGKTSLVQAGLLPALRATQGQEGSLVHACTTASVDLGAVDNLGPWGALAAAMLDWELDGMPLLSGHSIDSLGQALERDPEQVLHLLQVGLNARPPSLAAMPPLLVLDRLEALFQAGAEMESRTVIGCVDTLVRSRLVMVLAICRNDFYPRLADHAVLMHDKAHGSHMDLVPPDADAIAQIIRLPARAAKLVYGTDASGLYRLDDRLCAEAMQARDALPLLQYTLQALYLDRAPGDELTWDTYEALGGLDGAIGRRAEAVMVALPASQQDALPRLLPRLVTLTAEDAVPTSRWVNGSAFEDGDERAMVQALVEARLLVSDRIGGITGFRFAHEALLRRWPRVTAWVAQHRTILATRDELLPWVQRWVEGRRATALLLPQGAMLWQASDAIAEAPELFGRDECDYVAGSLARVKRQRRRRWAGLFGAIALAVVAALSAVRSAELAKLASQRELQSRRLASFMLGELADQLRPVGRLDLLGSIGEQGLQVLGRGAAKGESPFDTLQRAKALVVIGEVNSSRGKDRPGIAQAALVDARTLLAPLENSPGVPPDEYFKTLGASAFWLGQIAFDAGDFEKAAQEMSRYRDVCERWRTARPGDAKAMTELGFAFGSLGSIAVQRGAWNEASRWFQSSLALKLEVLSQHPDDIETLDAAANSRIWLGQIANVQGQARQALVLLDAAHGQLLALFEQHMDEAMRMRDLGALEIRRAEALSAMGRADDAATTMKTAVGWLERAVHHDPGNQRWQLESLHAQGGLLLMQVDAGIPILANLKSLQRRLGEHGRPEAAHDYLWRQASARAAAAEAGLAAQEGRWRHAFDQAGKTAQEVGELLRLRPHNWQSRELQARLGLLAMRASAQLGQADEHKAACTRTFNALQAAVGSGQAGVVLEAWLVARACSGSGEFDDEWLRRLTAGGYRPATPGIFKRLDPRR
jgi:tetratricopeptide (TPR) repeat protein